MPEQQLFPGRIKRMTREEGVVYDLAYAATELEYDSIMQMLEGNAMDSVVDALCTHCGYIEQNALEPDGYGTCPECRAPTYRSVLLIAGII